MQVGKSEEFQAASASLSRLRWKKNPKTNIAKDGNDESEINQIGFVRNAFVVIFGDLWGGFLFMAAGRHVQSYVAMSVVWSAVSWEERRGKVT